MRRSDKGEGVVAVAEAGTRTLPELMPAEDKGACDCKDDGDTEPSSGTMLDGLKRGLADCTTIRVRRVKQ